MRELRVGRLLRPLVLVSALVGMFALSGPAAAAPTTVSATVGPVAVPAVPVKVCVQSGSSTCTSTPAATTVSLSASATVDPGALTLPTVTPAACPGGQGVALVVNSGSAGTLVRAAVTLTVNGSPLVVPVEVPAIGPNQTVTISACVSPGVALPTAPALL